MIDPRDDLPPGLHASIERNTQALTRAFSAVLPAAVKALAPPSRGRTPTAPPRPAHEGEHTMSTPTEPNTQTIENATRNDVRPGDHLTWEWVQEIDGVTVKSSHEGIAHHQDEYGGWWTEGGMWLTSGDAGTLTIRRGLHAASGSWKVGK